MTKSSPADMMPAKLTPKERFALMGAATAFLLALSLLTSLSLAAALIASGFLIGFIWIYGGLASAGRGDKAQVNTDSLHRQDYRGEARLANSLDEALIIIDPKEQIVFINNRAQDLFPQARTGTALTSILRDVNILAQIRNVIDGKPAKAALISLSAPVERFFRVAAAALYGGLDDVTSLSDLKHETKPERTGARQRIVITLHDVTDLERANVVQADFLANASHELKTPVASLLGYIETLRGHARNDPDAQRRFLAIMQTQAERMQRLIDDLLSLRRIEQTEHIVPTDQGDITLAARAAIEALAPLAMAREVEITLEGTASLPVRGNQDELVQLVLNLIDNAVKMSSPGSKITISGKLSKDWKPDDAFSALPLAPEAIRRRIVNPPAPGKDHAVLRIRDRGPGFAKEHMPRIGERFYRIAGDRPGDSRGTGLGLAIVKHITLRHRGGLMVESAPGKGTEFTLILPTVMPASSET